MGMLFDIFFFWNVFAYHLAPVHVPPVVRVPQVGNPWSNPSCFKLKTFDANNSSKWSLKCLSLYRNNCTACFLSIIIRSSNKIFIIVLFLCELELTIDFDFQHSRLSMTHVVVRSSTFKSSSVIFSKKN